MSGTIDRLARGLLVLLGLMLIGMVALSVWNVFSRYIFSVSLLWADEIAVFAMIAMGWLGAIVCAWRGMEIRMNIVFDLFPPPLRTAVLVVQLVTIVGLCAWLSWLSWGYVARLMKFGMTSDGAGIPVWIVHSSVTISLACMSLIAAYRLARMLAGARNVSHLGAEVPPE